MMRSPSSFLLIQSVVILVQVHYSASSTCYYPNGAENDHTPCQDSQYSACCRKDALCLSNGLCFSIAELQLKRGSCTDSNWKVPECPTVCVASSPYGGVGLIACGNMHFACETDDCLKSNFMLPDTHLLLRDDQKRTIALSSMSISTSAGTTLNPSATLSTLTYTPTFTTSSSAARFSQGSRFVALGASVGVFLGIALFAVFALLLIEKRKNRRLVQAKHRITAENESSTGPIWINEYGPAVEVPQDLAQHELPSGRLAHELDDRRTRE